MSPQFVHLVTWHQYGAQCCEVFADIEAARDYADHMPVQNPIITTVAVRTAEYVAMVFGESN